MVLLQCNNLCKPTLSEYLPSDTPAATGSECTGKTQDHRRRVYTSECRRASNWHCEPVYTLRFIKKRDSTFVIITLEELV